MSKAVLYRSNHSVISYDERGFYYLHGIGYLSSRQWEEGALAFLEKLDEKNCLNVIVDQSRLKGTWLPRLAWMQNEFLPNVLRHGYLRNAFIYSKDSAAIHSLNRFLEISGAFSDKMELQAFDNAEVATQWILGKDMSEASEDIFRATGDNVIVTESSSEILTLRVEGKHLMIDVAAINYIWSSKGKAYIFTTDNPIITISTLSNLLKKLPPYFQQINRSYLVNTKKIHHIEYFVGGAYKAYLKELPKIKLPISRKYAPRLKKFLGI